MYTVRSKKGCGYRRYRYRYRYRSRFRYRFRFRWFLPAEMTCMHWGYLASQSFPEAG